MSRWSRETETPIRNLPVCFFFLCRKKNKITSTVMKKKRGALKGPSARFSYHPPTPSERAPSSDREAAASQQRGRSSGSGDRKCQLHTARKTVGHVVMHNSCRLIVAWGVMYPLFPTEEIPHGTLKHTNLGPPIRLTRGVHLRGESRWVNTA